MYIVLLVIVIYTMMIFHRMLVMTMMVISDVSYWHAHYYAHECLVYVSNMSSDDVSHGLLTVKMMFYVFLLNTQCIFSILSTF